MEDEHGTWCSVQLESFFLIVLHVLFRNVFHCAKGVFLIKTYKLFCKLKTLSVNAACFCTALLYQSRLLIIELLRQLKTSLHIKWMAI